MTYSEEETKISFLINISKIKFLDNLQGRRKIEKLGGQDRKSF